MSRENQAQDSLVWPLVECPRWLTVQFGGRPHRPSRHFAHRVLLIANRHGRADEQMWGVSLNVHEVVAEGQVEVVHNQPVDVQPRIVVHERLSNISNQLRQQQRSVEAMLQLRRVKRAAVGRDGSMTLKECDQKAVAVVAAIQGEPRVLRGSAAYFVDSALGNCLCIKIDDPESAGVELLLCESEWRGRITPDATYGCDAIVYLDQNHCLS
ncbi:MAG TPA: hypothetical protein VMP01_07480 [Pirellulaceae bacterium]|nr:hypothetical protein [Pirellulaceae bacterium]